MSSRNRGKNDMKGGRIQEENNESYSDADSDGDYKEDILSEGDSHNQEDELREITAWGNKKTAFYEQEEGKESDEDLEDEEEEEAKLIEKLQNEKFAHQDFFDVFGDQEADKKGRGDEEIEEEEIDTYRLIKNRLKEMEDLADNVKIGFVKKESPELTNIVNELRNGIREIKYKLIPVMAYVRSQKTLSKEVLFILKRNNMSINYLDIRFNLLTTYCMHLSFYILLKINGKTVQDHPVIQRIVKMKTFLDQLRVLNKSIEPQITKILRGLQQNTNKKVEEEKTRNVSMPDTNNKRIGAKIQEKKVQLSNETPISEKKIMANNMKGQSKKTPENVNGKRKVDGKRDTRKVKNANLESDFSDSEEEDEFYRQVKKLKEARREKIQQAKQDKLAEQFEEDPSHYVGEDEVRAINRKILKNKGLVRKRKKVDRNSRVKLRNKYDKALYKQKTKGHHYRENKDTYHGEITGIKSGLIKSTKLKDM